MRALVLAVCVFGGAGTAAAQDGEPRPFLSGEPSFARSELTGSGNLVGFDLTLGTKAWRAVQPIFQGGRLVDVMPADFVLDPVLAQAFSRRTSTWYGAAGARFLTPRVWWFQPYAETTAGVAHMDSQAVAASLFQVSRVVPVVNMAAGAEFRIGKHFTIDAGYRTQSFYGDASVTRVGPRLGFGVRF